MSADAEPRRLRDVLGQLGRELGIPPPDATDALGARWPEIVGPALAGHVAPGSLRAGVLTVHADAPAWAAELRWLQGDLLVRLGDVLGPDVVRGIRVVVGPLPTRSPNES